MKVAKFNAVLICSGAISRSNKERCFKRSKNKSKTKKRKNVLKSNKTNIKESANLHER